MATSAEIDWKTRAEEAERRAAEAWEAYHRIAADRADSEHYKHVIRGYEQSLSWRVTSPLRLGLAIVRWFMKKVKGTLRSR